MTKKDTETRVEELEIALAHQQRLCEQLNEVVTSQTEELMKLTKLLPALQSQVQELKASARGQGTASIDEKPPHY
ncbi:MAG: SlyX family protein [Pirellulaceae bacterium]